MNDYRFPDLIIDPRVGENKFEFLLVQEKKILSCKLWFQGRL
jgi:hypothetical protein